MYEIYYFMKKITLIIMEGAQFDQTTTVQYSLQTVRPRRYSQNLNCSVLCPLPPTFGLSRVYDSITLTDKTPKTGKISTKMCRSIPFCLSYWTD